MVRILVVGGTKVSGSGSRAPGHRPCPSLSRRSRLSLSLALPGWGTARLCRELASLALAWTFLLFSSGFVSSLGCHPAQAYAPDSRRHFQGSVVNG